MIKTIHFWTLIIGLSAFVLNMVCFFVCRRKQKESGNGHLLIQHMQRCAGVNIGISITFMAMMIISRVAQNH